MRGGGRHWRPEPEDNRSTASGTLEDKIIAFVEDKMHDIEWVLREKIDSQFSTEQKKMQELRASVEKLLDAPRPQAAAANTPMEARDLGSLEALAPKTSTVAPSQRKTETESESSGGAKNRNERRGMDASDVESIDKRITQESNTLNVKMNIRFQEIEDRVRKHIAEMMPPTTEQLRGVQEKIANLAELSEHLLQLYKSKVLDLEHKITMMNESVNRTKHKMGEMFYSEISHAGNIGKRSWSFWGSPPSNEKDGDTSPSA